ncbi:hypothetical protein FB45DRAFT_344556 [Roridomyces roridus]|uniref:Asl1-like glycosyl hydrolase catalytic domain-containing protein n=1 Tax=Roridomyces roridus TaxID=1738132 RepID=A0AAD7B3P0_9AGAR|nr:hypothetical protein FB45DRAFT_344556 [Roridomyces roridus]
MIKKRVLLWDWTNTRDVPSAMDAVNFEHICAVSNWNTWTPAELKNRAPFRPMVRTKDQLAGQDWENVLHSNQPIIHFFNEPERAGVSAAEAASLWEQHMVPLRSQHGKKLVSPSCASDANGKKWITEFLERVKTHPPDFLGMHYYGTNGDEAIKYITELHNEHSHLPVIVSEIASISRDKGQVYAFTAKLANWMDGTGWVHEYGFFGCMRHVADGFVSPEAQLMDANGHFTELMERLMTEEPVKA